MLDQVKSGGHRVIDRAKPDESLLTTYLLPSKDVKPELQHPGGVKYKPIATNRAAREYRVIDNWIRSLKHPSEDYGVNLVDKPGTSQPAEGAPTSRPATPMRNR